MAENTVNLIDDRQITAWLIARGLDWRVRSVEAITVDSATSCSRRRSLQATPLRTVLADVPGLQLDADTSHAFIALNVATVPRGPLVDFDIEGPLGDAWLLPRQEIAARQALFLTSMASSFHPSPSSDLVTLLTAILGFTGEFFSSREAVALEDYLSVGIGQAPSATFLEHCRSVANDCRHVLRPHLDRFHGYSAPENPTLALPELVANGLIAMEAQATTVLEEYRGLILAADSAATPEAEVFLEALADYGNYYDLIAAMRIPLDEPFMVKYSERRDLKLSWPRREGRQELVIADAQSNHATFKVTDPNVRISVFQAVQMTSDEFAVGAFQSRKDQQSRAIYAHDPDRDFRIRFRFQLGLLRRLQTIPYVATALLVLLSLALLHEKPEQLRDLALIVGPAALAASVLLVREPSTLGSRLRLTSSLLLAIALGVLVLVATFLYVRGLLCA
ncbi:hypothetical protein [Curtobacterium sp. MCBD17_013]|uniref:hypothetical protein n=1 Tax=Curtobacterium sp. MCBD17_013 TaxID=2175668 RepID=UPI0011B42358|nr:hypothetical protein [Curtobacterium sp. MCBD17_013]